MKRTRKNVPSGFDSWFEVDFCELMPDAEKHADQVPYVQRRVYNPDFTLRLGPAVVYIECKGRFRDRPEARKYVDVRESLGENEELVFVFVNPDKPMPGARRRKNGTIYTHGEWADQQGFRWFTLQTVKENLS